jgi:hypothetical protein
MPKYKLITKTLDPRPENFELYEEVIDADNVMIDQTGRYLLFCTASKIEAPVGPQGPQISLRIIKWINTDCVVECFDIHYISKVVQALSN